MTAFEQLKETLRSRPKTWLVTGAAGFIGSNLVEHLLSLGQRVVGLDNFATGHRRNLEQVEMMVNPSQWNQFRFEEGDIRNAGDCLAAVRGVDVVLHQAALGSVPYSMEHPVEAHHANVSGMVNILDAARQSGVGRVVYASSSAVYGDNPDLPKVEASIGGSLSPYAATKLADEIYAGVFSRCYDMQTVGLRYFNVFGPRQDPNGAYAAVIPKWIAAMLSGEPVFVNGDGETSRDFCHVANVVQANLLAACREFPGHFAGVFNIAVGERTALNELFQKIRENLAAMPGRESVAECQSTHREFREGDIRHSLADISLARAQLGFTPTIDVSRGMAETIDWYVRDFEREQTAAQTS